jgi:molecular chaperone DnaJ
MRGKGFPKLRGGQKGDQLVRIQVSTPKSLSKKEKDLFSELASLNGKLKPKFNKVDF